MNNQAVSKGKLLNVWDLRRDIVYKNDEMWVNQQGWRFVREIAGRVPDFGSSVPAVLRQAQLVRL